MNVLGSGQEERHRCWRERMASGSIALPIAVVADERSFVTSRVRAPSASMTRKEPAVLLAATVVALAVSRIGAAEPGTWVLEVFPIFLAIPVLVATAKRFPLTPLAYRLGTVCAMLPVSKSAQLLSFATLVFNKNRWLFRKGDLRCLDTVCFEFSRCC